MAIATSTAIILGVTAAASAYSAKKQSDASNNATKAQERGTTQAINEQRRQQTQERDRLRQMWDYWQGNRNQLMAKYGLDVPSTARGDNPFDDAHDRYMQEQYARNRAVPRSAAGRVPGPSVPVSPGVPADPRVTDQYPAGGNLGDLAQRGRVRPDREWA